MPGRALGGQQLGDVLVSAPLLGPEVANVNRVATLVDVTGLVIYFSIALIFLRGTLL